MSDLFESIREKKINGIKIDSTRECILFETDSGLVGWETDGDCCSESWIEHIEGVGSIINSEILSVEEINGGEIEGTRQDVDSIYFFKIKTTKGYAQIEMRNSSNGYYGGSLEVICNPERRFYGLDMFQEYLTEDF